MYHNFIGIDISKADFTVVQHGIRVVHTFDNSLKGFQDFSKQYETVLVGSLVVLETTGGYEMSLVSYLISQGVAVHRANTRKVKYFIRSLGKEAKTDAIDAAGLARYGYERQQSLELFVIKSTSQQKLQQLIQRRLDLKKILVQEKNRRQAPNQHVYVIQSCNSIIQSLEKEMEALQKEVQSLFDEEPEQKEKQKVLREIKGIGPIISGSLLALLPELGRINRREIASLVGLAPHPYESGQMVGYRKTKGGRQDVRCLLFMAAMTAAQSNGRLGEYYRGLIGRGKKKMVALTALMRKIVVIANAKMTDWYKTQEQLIKNNI